MRISVIVPVYNVANYLRYCLDSILNQDYHDFEVLLIDDGSTDSSSQICLEYEECDRRFRYYRKENGGLSSARNYGIREASGEWLVFIDSDDFWFSKDCLSNLSRLIQQHSVDIIRFEYSAVDEYGQFLYAHSIDKKKLIAFREISSYEMFHHGVAGEFFVVLYLFRRSIIGELTFNEKITFQEDVDFLIRLFATREMRCLYLPNRFYGYRKRRYSITATSNIEQYRCSFSLCDDIYNHSLQMTNDRLAQEYRFLSIIKYYRTLSSLAENYKCYCFLKELNLFPLYMRTVLRMCKSGSIGKFSIFIIPPPLISVCFIKIKNHLVAIMHKIFAYGKKKNHSKICI